MCSKCAGFFFCFFFAIFCHLGQKKEACSTICEFEKMCNEETRGAGQRKLLAVAVKSRGTDKYTPNEERHASRGVALCFGGFPPSEPEM